MSLLFFTPKKKHFVIEGRTRNDSAVFNTPLIMGNDGYIYVIKYDESKIIEKYLLKVNDELSWNDLSNNKKIKLVLEEIEIKKKESPKFGNGIYEWQISTGTGVPLISGYPPIKGTYRVVKVIEPPH